MTIRLQINDAVQVTAEGSSFTEVVIPSSATVTIAEDQHGQFLDQLMTTVLDNVDYSRLAMVLDGLDEDDLTEVMNFTDHAAPMVHRAALSKMDLDEAAECFIVVARHAGYGPADALAAVLDAVAREE